MQPARELGIPTVWINRQGEQRDESIVGAALGDLGGLAAVVERVATG
jgi:FMN phosphatase YigB (HAD superfamily)